MADDTNAQGTPAPEQPTAEQPSWSAPPTGSAPPPPPPPDSTGSMPTPQAATNGGGGVNLSVGNPLGLALGVVAVVGVVLGLVLSADVPGGGSVSFWDDMGWTWAVLGIVAAVATLLPVVGKAAGLSSKQVVGIVTIAAGVLGLWWVLFILPAIDSNRAFLATVGVLAAAGAAWVARNDADES